MELFLDIFLFLLGILLVVKGGDIFVDSASALAKSLRIPTFIIGATIVSLATTMPEMIVSALAAAEGKTEMAVGNAVGSVTANTALIMAIGMICMSIACPRKKYMVPSLLLLAASATLTLSCLGGRLELWGSILLFVIFCSFMAVNILSGKREATGLSAGGESLTASMENPEMPEKTAEPTALADRPPFKMLLKYILFFLVGAGAIVGGSQLMVNYGSAIALRVGIPERVIAVTMIAIGTSLPELVTTITAIIKKESSLSIGNIIGANIIDLSLILPICSLVSGQYLPVSEAGLRLDIPVCLFTVLLAVLPITMREKTAKWQGFALLGAYTVYMVFTVLSM